MRIRFHFVWVVLLIALPLPVYSLGDSEGWRGEGWDGEFPVRIEADAMILSEHFEASPLEDLQNQQILGTLCENNRCAGRISEGQASKILDRLIAKKERVVAQQERREAVWVSRLGIFLALLSFVTAYFAYRRSGRYERGLDGGLSRSASENDNLKTRQENEVSSSR